MTQAEQKRARLAIVRLAKWLLKQADGTIVTLDAQLEGMDNFEISVQEAKNPHFKATQIVFRLQAK